jgi:hypothetical protein
MRTTLPLLAVAAMLAGCPRSDDTGSVSEPLDVCLHNVVARLLRFV